MKIYELTDPEFRKYGKVLEGIDTEILMKKMDEIPCGRAVDYLPAIESLENCSSIYGRLQDSVFGGMPIQVGMCWGRNTRLNCLEYHRDSEINLGSSDFILLLARIEEIEDGKLNTSKVKAFRIPRGVWVEVYATTLHYAPCSISEGEEFHVAVVLPKGTNTEVPAFERKSYEDSLMTARNKWLLAHEESAEAQDGAVVALTGVNIDLASEY